jgi:hypothetical protein
MARPTKLTPELQKKVIEAIRLGATYELAAAYAGIHYDTFHRWMTKGKEAQSGAFCVFYEDVSQADGVAVVGWLAKIEKAASDGAWQAAAWKLERRHPEGYGPQVKMRHGGDPDNPAPIEQRGTFTIQIDSRRGEDADSEQPADTADL